MRIIDCHFLVCYVTEKAKKVQWNGETETIVIDVKVSFKIEKRRKIEDHSVKAKDLFDICVVKGQ